MQSIFSIRFNNNSHYFTASCTMHTRFNGNYSSAYTGVYRSTDESGSFTNLLTNFYGIANLNDRVSRSSQMLWHGNYNSLRIREFLQINMFTEFLVFWWMNTAVISVQSVFSDRFHIVIDDLEINFGEITNLYRLIEKFFQTSLFCQSLIDFFPCTILIRIHFAFSVLCSAALSIYKTFWTVNDRTDASGNVQIALCTSITALLCKCHTMMASVVKGIACGNDRFASQIRNSLNTKTTGNYYYILCTFWNQIL